LCGGENQKQAFTKRSWQKKRELSQVAKKLLRRGANAFTGKRERKKNDSSSSRVNPPREGGLGKEKKGLIPSKTTKGKKVVLQSKGSGKSREKDAKK